jgi:Co/Zn/Cd efflux system component
VTSIHHVHVWSLTDEQTVVTLHVVIREGADPDRALVDIQRALREKCKVEHATVQIERATNMTLRDLAGCESCLEPKSSQAQAR